MEVRKVNHYFISIPNKVGEGARLLATLKNAGINLIALWGYPGKPGEAQFELIPVHGDTFPEVAQKLGLSISLKQTAFFINGFDRPGVIANILEKLAEEGIDIGVLQAVSTGEGHFGAVVFLPQKDVDAAARLLGAS